MKLIFKCIFSLLLMTIMWGCVVNHKTNIASALINNKVMPFEIERLFSSSWHLVTYQTNSMTVPIDTTQNEVVLNFEVLSNRNDIRIYGRALCNNYFGTCTISDTQILFNQNIGFTKMLCDPLKMQLEDTFLAMLPKMTNIHFANTQNQPPYQLILSNNTKKQFLIFKASELK